MSTIVITGGSRGIGAAAVKLFAAKGHRVYFLYEKNHDAAKSVADATGATAICCDVANGEAVKKAFSAMGDVDVLICNAGMLLFSTLVRTAPERLHTIIELHCTTTTLLCRYFGEEMKEKRRGRILIMSSSTAWLPYPTITHYAATKAYIKSFAFALWYELHRYGVSVTAVFPGAVDTPFYNLSPSMRKLFRTLGIMMSPEAIAKRGIKAMMRGVRRVTPGLFTKFVVGVCAILPARLLDLFIRIKPIRELLERV
jgi:short-subunit dehydrogenase